MANASVGFCFLKKSIEEDDILELSSGWSVVFGGKTSLGGCFDNEERIRLVGVGIGFRRAERGLSVV